MILALDPGTRETGIVAYNPKTSQVASAMVGDNETLVNKLPVYTYLDGVACEWIESFMMRVGSDVFETVYWTGRFHEAWGNSETFHRVTRKEVKLHLLGTVKGNDADVRAALIERFGPGRKLAIGNKKAPGPLYRVKSHAWSALAVAVTYCDTKQQVSNSSLTE